MKNLLLVVSLIFGFSLTSIGQSPSPTPQRETQQQIEISREINRQGNQRIREIADPRLNPQYDINQERDRMIASVKASNLPSQSTNAGFSLPTITKDQIKYRLPHPEDSAKYANFLKLPHTGLIKLFPELDCSSKNVVRVDGLCENYAPFSSAYSFRKTTYTEISFADVSLKDDTLFTNKLFSTGLILALGDIPLENVSTNTAGMKFLFDYQPATENKSRIAKSKDLTKGIQNGDYQYSDHFSVFENTTYALRVIAYRGKIIKRPSNFPWITFNLLQNDKRFDLIVAFRIVRKESDGALTLLWKELQRKDSPKINLSEEEQEQF